MHLRPVEHLENRRPKWKMHTQEWQLTRFFVFYNWTTKKTEPTVLFKTEPNPRFFSKLKLNFKNPFRTSLTKIKGREYSKSHAILVYYLVQQAKTPN